MNLALHCHAAQLQEKFQMFSYKNHVGHGMTKSTTVFHPHVKSTTKCCDCDSSDV